MNDHDPSVVIFGGGNTALAVTRALKAIGRPIVVGFDDRDICRYSRNCEYRLGHKDYGDETDVTSILEKIGEELPSRAVLIPCSDILALAVARCRESLSRYYYIWQNSEDELAQLVDKVNLYSRAKTIGIRVPDSVFEPTLSELQDWTRSCPPPYFAKPGYSGKPNASLKFKNQLFSSREELYSFVRESGSSSLIVQQYIGSADGNLYDVYGLNDRNGISVTVETHRRIRQWPVGRGITSYGEIPVTNDSDISTRIVENTLALFEGIPYHGIFGVEWMHEKTSNELYLIDVNCRPFSSIGHLEDSGINLPELAYFEAIGDTNRVLDIKGNSSVRHTYWIHFARDLRSALYHKEVCNDVTLCSWLLQIASARSFAFFRLSDPMPFVIETLSFVGFLIRALVKKSRNWITCVKRKTG